MSMEETMNVWARPGTRVRFAFPGNGYQSDQTFAAERLAKDGIYTVHMTEVGGSHTSVYLREVEGSFNSVMFSEALENKGEAMKDTESQFDPNTVQHYLATPLPLQASHLPKPEGICSFELSACAKPSDMRHLTRSR